jgi:translation initiation factor IF-2
MAKRRLFELAKELKMKTRDLQEALVAEGVEVKSHMTQVEEELVRKILAKKSAGSSSADSEVLEKAETSTTAQAPLPSIKVPEGITVRDFAEKVQKSPTEILKILMELGEFLTINQSMSREAVELVSEHLGFQVEFTSPFEEISLEAEPEPEGEPVPRPPVVTVMGHVDHGKTTLLDAIRQTNVVASEFGGITQHIGAYQVEHKGKKITFIDTPGHEAFTAMRARGAKVTDIAVLVVAADDGVMPQTIEAINHAKAAGVPILVAINKIDKEGANPDKIKQQLTEHGLVAEEWGGDTIFVSVSAKQKINLDELLEMILLLAEVQELKAVPNGPARGVVIESKLDRGRGPVATVLIEKGALQVGNAVVAGLAYGKIRAMFDDRGQPVEKALPAQPVEVLGLSTVPEPGVEMVVVGDEKKARQIAEERALKARVLAAQKKHVSLEELFASRKEKEEEVVLNLIVKADTHGSLEAVKEALEKIRAEGARVKILHGSVGAITEADVMLASASDAVVVGFNVRPDGKTRNLAQNENIEIRTYRVIYELTEEIEAALKGRLKPEFYEETLGLAEVRATFKISRLGVVAGCYVTEGKITKDSKVRLLREGSIIFEGEIASLRRFKEDVNEVKSGFECGVRLEGFNDVKVGDIIEAYQIVEKKRT